VRERGALLLDRDGVVRVLVAEILDGPRRGQRLACIRTGWHGTTTHGVRWPKKTMGSQSAFRQG
jgi:hypothetical protein